MFIKKSLNLLEMIFLSVVTSSFPIRNFVFERPLFISIYFIFNQTPWSFHVIFIFQNKIMVIFLFSHFHQILQFALVFFVVFFIKRWFYSFTFLYNLFLYLIEFFKASDSQGFLLLYFLFTFIFGKCLLNRATSWLWNISNAPLGVWSSVHFIPVSCTKSWMKWIFIRWSK